jgi:hypothetical protein
MSLVHLDNHCISVPTEENEEAKPETLFLNTADTFTVPLADC